MTVVIWMIGSQTPQVRNFGHEFTRTCDALFTSPDRDLVIDAVRLTGSVRDQVSLGCVTAAGSIQSQLSLALAFTVLGTVMLLFFVLRSGSRRPQARPHNQGRTGARIVTGLLLVTLVAGSVTALIQWNREAELTVSIQGSEQSVTTTCPALSTATRPNSDVTTRFSSTVSGAYEAHIGDMIESSSLNEQLGQPVASDVVAAEITFACLQVRESQTADLHLTLTITGIITAVLLTLLTVGAAGRRAPTTV